MELSSKPQKNVNILLNTNRVCCSSGFPPLAFSTPTSFPWRKELSPVKGQEFALQTWLEDTESAI